VPEQWLVILDTISDIITLRYVTLSQIKTTTVSLTH